MRLKGVRFGVYGVGFKVSRFGVKVSHQPFEVDQLEFVLERGG